MTNHIIKPTNPEEKKQPGTGGLPAQQQPPAETQRIPEEGEHYLREGGKIEDYPSHDDRRPMEDRNRNNDPEFGGQKSPDAVY